MFICWSLVFMAVILDEGVEFVETTSKEEIIGQYVEDAVTNLKLKIHQAAQRHEGRTRRRRSNDNGFVNTTALPGHEVLINSIAPFYSLPTSHAVELQPFNADGTQYIAVVNSKDLNGKNIAYSEIYQVKGEKFLLSQTFLIPGCVDFEFMNFGVEKYVVFVEKIGTGWNGKESYDRSYHVYRYVPPVRLGDKPFQYMTNVAMHGGTQVKGFLHKNKQYFVAANSFAERGNRRNAKSALHIKTHFGFLLVQEFQTQGAEDVEVFVMGGLVYLVFANHMDNQGLVDIYSTVYRESRKVSPNGLISFEYVQRILTHGARDFHHFTMKKNNYIVVANEYSQLLTYDTTSNPKKLSISNDYEINSIIYWWSGTVFVEWQRIPTNGAKRWSNFNGPKGEAFLTVANSKSQAVIYVYDPIKGLFKPTSVQGLSPVSNNIEIPDVRSVQAYSSGNYTYLAVANYNQSGGYNIFKVNYTYSTLPVVGATSNGKLKSALAYVTLKMNELKNRVDQMKRVLSNIMTVHSNQTVYGTTSFTNVVINKLTVNTLVYSKRAENNPIEKAVLQAIQIKKKLTLQNGMITELQKKLSDSVAKTGFQNITGKKTFTGKITFENLVVNHLKAGKVDGVNVTDFAGRAWSKSKPQNITGSNVFMRDVTMLKDLNVTGTLNGIRVPDDIMTTNTEQHVTGKKMFTEGVTSFGNISTVNFTVNGLRIPEDLVLRGTNQVIEGKKIFNSSVRFLKSVIVNGTVNGKDLSKFSKRVVTLSTDQVITGEKTFVNGFKVDKDLNVSGLVDGVNLTNLDLDAARIHNNETIRGRKRILGSLTAARNVKTLSTTNGYRLQDDVMTTTTDQIINASKTFKNIHVQGSIITSSTIDGIDLSKEAVTMSGDQTILGKKTFENDVTVNGNIYVNGTVDGVDVSEMDRNVVKINEENVVTAEKVFTGKITVGNISISDRINNIQLKKLRERIWRINGNQTISAPMTFENVHILSNLNVNGTVNSVRIPGDLIPLNSPQEINSDLTFVDAVTFEKGIEMRNDSKLNGENLSEFAKTVVLNGTDQVILGTKTFTSNVTVRSNINIDGKINGYKVPDDFVTLNTVQNISGAKIFENGVTVLGNLSAGAINVSTTVNGVDVSELPKDAVYREENQTIFGKVTFTGNVTSVGPITVGKLVDGVNLAELASTAVRSLKPQNITGRKVFTEDVEFYGPLKSPGSINEVNLLKLDANSLKTTGEQFVSGKKIFEKTVNIEGDIINGTINRINLGEFRKKIVTKSGSETITGNLRFMKNVSFENLDVRGKIDGVKIEELMLTYGDQVVQGNKKIIGDLIAEKDVTVGGKINDVNLTKLDAEVMRTKGDQNVTGALVFENGFGVGGSINNTGLINGVDISELNSKVVKVNGEQIIGGQKTFLKDVVIKGDVNFKQSLNGMNISHLLDDVVLKDRNQVISAEKIFASKNGITVLKRLKAGNIKVSELVDGVNITDLNAKAVRLSTDQEISGELIFKNSTYMKSNVTVKGLVNGVSVPNDVLLTFKDQVITGRKTFRNLIANSSIVIDGKIDGVDVSEFAKSRVTLSTNQTVVGAKSFTSHVQVEGSVHLPNNGTVNGIDVSEEVLMKNGPVYINGEKTFTNEMKVNGSLNVTGLVNGIDLKKMDKTLMRVNGTKPLTGLNIFHNKLFVRGNVSVGCFINGVNISNIQNAAKVLEEKTSLEIAKLNSTLKPICAQIKVLHTLAGVETYLSGIEKEKEFPLSKHGHIDSTTIGNDVFTTVARSLYSGCGPAYILRCTPSLSCTTLKVVMTRAVRMQFYEISGQWYIFVGHHGKKATSCPVYPEILKYDPATKNFFSLHNVTSSNYNSIAKISDNEIVVQNIASLIPTSLLSSALFTTPISSLGSSSLESPVMTRTFKQNGTMYLVISRVLVDIYSVELYVLNTTTYAAKKLQQITTREVSAIDIGLVEGKTMLVVAEERLGSEHDVKLYSFVAKKRKFYFYQRIAIIADALQLREIKEQSYLVFSSPDNGFGLCPWRGMSGFEQCMSVPDVGINFVTTVSTTSGVFALGNTNTKLVIYQASFKGMTPKYNVTLNC